MPRHIYPEQWQLTDKAKSLDLSHPHGTNFDPACPYCVRGKGVGVKAYYAAMPDGVLVNEWHTLMGARRREHCRNGAFHDLTVVIPLMEERGLLMKRTDEEAEAAEAQAKQDALAAESAYIAEKEAEAYEEWQADQEPPPGYSDGPEY